MKGLLKHDDFGALNALVVPKLAGYFERGFVGFKTRVAEKHIAHARERCQLGGKLLLQGHVVVVGSVYQLADLLLQCGHKLGVGVPQRIDSNAAQSVQIALAVYVPHMAAFAM